MANTTAPGGEAGALRKHDLTVPQYACLELLDQRPCLSNAELARGAFVARQSMNVVLRGLQDTGLISRPLTADGRSRLDAARSTVYTVERQMVDAIPQRRLALLLADLDRMAQALGG